MASGTTMVEPTGLSPENRSSAADLVAVLVAATAYPDIARVTSQAQILVEQAGGRTHALKNTNHLVGKKGWEILLSKTGFTNEAGRCVAMRLRSAGRTVLVVLLDAAATTGRTLDALNITRLVAGDTPLLALPIEAGNVPTKRIAKAGTRKKAAIRAA